METNSSEQFDLAIVGGGILGLACAYAAAKVGQRVLIVERDKRACSASVRNFGMIWPIGQPAGKRLDLALQSRKIWLELKNRLGIAVRECGSIHVAHQADEWDLLQEFAADANDRGFDVRLLTRDEVLRRSPAVKPDGLRGGLHSSTECGVDPPQCIAALTEALVNRLRVEFVPATPIVKLEPPWVFASDGRNWRSNRIVVATGADIQLLYPARYHQAGLRLCKLHMLSTRAQPSGFRVGPHLASGLTLRHYATFANCQSLARVKQRVDLEEPALDRLGIHVMMSQPADGRVIVGDSHQYDDDISVFNEVEIDELILQQLSRVFELPDWTIERRWVGYYLKHPKSAYFLDAPDPHVRLLTGLGGNGMTLSMGVGQRLIENFEDPSLL